MITKEMVEAGVAAFESAFNGSPNSTEMVTTIFTAALAAMPGPAVKDVGQEVKQNYNCPCIHPSQCDNSCLTPAPDLASENERLRAALEKIIDWASRRCPADDESVPCPLCGARADIPGDACKAVESIFPRDLLRDTRAALERT